MKTYFIIVGSALLAFGIWLACRRIYTYFAGVSVMGTICVQKVSSIDETITYLPTVKFFDLEGNEHTFSSGAGSDKPIQNIGKQVSIIYLPSNPKIVYINSFLHLWAAPLAFVMLGLSALYAAFWPMQHVSF